MESCGILKLVQKVKILLMIQAIYLQNLVNFEHQEHQHLNYKFVLILKFRERCKWKGPLASSP
jgi:hypothetical protein